MIRITKDALKYLEKKEKYSITIEYPEHRTNC